LRALVVEYQLAAIERPRRLGQLAAHLVDELIQFRGRGAESAPDLFDLDIERAVFQRLDAEDGVVVEVAAIELLRPDGREQIARPFLSTGQDVYDLAFQRRTVFRPLREQVLGQFGSVKSAKGANGLDAHFGWPVGLDQLDKRSECGRVAGNAEVTNGIRSLT